MATGTAADFKVHHEFVHGGMFEAMEQEIEIFNRATAGAVVLEARGLKGDYEYLSFFPSITNLVTRRDLTSVSAATILKMTEDEYISVKVARKAGPVQMNADAFKKKGLDSESMSFLLGREIGRRRVQDMANTALSAVATALEAQTALTNDITGAATKTLNHSALNAAFAKRGDKANEIATVVLHSKPHFDLTAEQFSSQQIAFGAAGQAYRFGTSSYHGRSVFITDSSALVDLNGSLTDTYNVLGLVPGAVIVTQSEPDDMIFEKVGGNENIQRRYQAEWSYNVAVKGVAWDVTNGGANPNATALATTTNWDQVDTSDKTLPGVLLVCQ